MSIPANTKTKIGVCVGGVISLVAPFLQNLFAYLEGREVLSYGASLLSFLALLIAGPASGIIILLWSFFDNEQRWYRLLFGSILFFGSPFYFWGFVQPSAKLELIGLADATKSKVNLVALQNWAVQTLSEKPLMVSSNFPFTPAQTPLEWNHVPIDARVFLGTNGIAFIEYQLDGQANIMLEASPKALKIGTTNLILPTDEFWNYKLAPGIYLQHQIRP